MCKPSYRHNLWQDPFKVAICSDVTSERLSRNSSNGGLVHRLDEASANWDTVEIEYHIVKELK